MTAYRFARKLFISELSRVLCQLVKTMHSTFERPQSLGDEIAMVNNMF